MAVRKLEENYLVPCLILLGRFALARSICEGYFRPAKSNRISAFTFKRIKIIREQFISKNELELLNQYLEKLKTKDLKNSRSNEKKSRDIIWPIESQMILGLSNRVHTWHHIHRNHYQALESGSPSASQLAYGLALRSLMWCELGENRRTESTLEYVYNFCCAIKNTKMSVIIYLLKAMLLDYNRKLPGEMRLKLGEALDFLTPLDEQFIVPKALSLTLFEKILAGDINETLIFAKKNLELWQASSLCTLQWGAYKIFGNFLIDRRDIILSWGEDVLDKFSHYPEDGLQLYFNIISLFVAHSKGDLNGLKKSYHRIGNFFDPKSTHSFLFGFEADFCALILLFIPRLIEQEHKVLILEPRAMKSLLINIDSFLKKKSRQSDLHNLLRGKVSSDLDVRPGIKFFDRAIKTSILIGNKFVSCLTYFWFSLDLPDLGANKKGYMELAYRHSKVQGFKILESMIRNEVAGQPHFFDRSFLNSKQDPAELPLQKFPTNLAHSHLGFIAKEFVTESSYKHTLQKSLSLLFQKYGAHAVFLYLCDKNHQKIFNYPQLLEESSVDEDALKKHLSYFLQIKRPHLLAYKDSSWNILLKPDLKEMTSDKASKESSTETEKSSTSGQNQAINPLVHIDLDLDPKEYVQVYDDEVQKDVANKLSFVNAYIPVSVASGSLGLLALAGMDQRLYQNKSLSSREELEYYASQLGLFLQYRSRSPQQAPYSAQFTGHWIEQVSWLKIMPVGENSQSQECAWCFGCTLPEEQYLLFFCSLQGGEKWVREHLSAMLWFHCRSLEVLTKINIIKSSVDCFRDHVAGVLKQTPGVDTLGQIGLAFSIFTKGGEQIECGHFGASRPLVLASSSKVKPYSESIASYDNGRELRFWEVAISWEEVLPFFVCKDTRYFEWSIDPAGQRQAKEKLAGIKTSLEFERFLRKIGQKSHIPPYYIIVLPASILDT